MNKQGYPVEWRQQTLYLSDLTDGVKADYCAWLYRSMLAAARQRMEAAQYFRYEDKLTASPPEWTSLPDEAVLASFDRVPARRQLLRLLLGATDRELSDDELDQMSREKEADPLSDLSVAMKQVREKADPKAQPAGGGSPAAMPRGGPAGSELTPPSATTPSASTPIASAG